MGHGIRLIAVRVRVLKFPPTLSHSFRDFQGLALFKPKQPLSVTISLPVGPRVAVYRYSCTVTVPVQVPVQAVTSIVSSSTVLDISRTCIQTYLRCHSWYATGYCIMLHIGTYCTCMLLTPSTALWLKSPKHDMDSPPDSRITS